MFFFAMRVFKLLGAVVLYPFLEAWRVMGKLFGQRFRGIAVAVYYHGIPAKDAMRFARQMDHVARWSEPIRADQSERPHPGSRSVIITFDDGWHSFFTTAMPEIRRRQIPVTVFAIAERLGETIDGIVEERLMTPDELCRLPRDCVTVGSHSCTHANVPSLEEQEGRRELRHSREVLEDLTKREVKLFCFPYGRFSPDSIRLCAEEGYQRVFTGMPTLALKDGHDFVVGRIKVEPTDWLIEFHLKISGAYCWVPLAIAAKRALHSGLGSFARSSSRTD